MENNIQVFKNEQFGEIRTIIKDNEPWFVGKDVAEVLGYSRTADAIRQHVDDEDKVGSKMDTSFGIKETTIINESGLYSLILSSKLPQAKEFKRWVTSEGLPLITQNGVKIGQTRLFYWLRLNGYLFKKKAGRRPIQKWVEMDKRL